jgi:TetR/AcrR family transcriptional regulator, lmrAB and yxaGH operons repressor
MPRRSDSRTAFITTAIGLFRRNGIAATGLASIIEESGAPRGSFYHYFPAGKDELILDSLRAYGAGVAAMLCSKVAESPGDPQAFMHAVVLAVEAEMAQADWTCGCLVQALLNEPGSAGEDVLCEVQKVVDSWLGPLAQGLGGDPDRALAFLSALQGARGLARLSRNNQPFRSVSANL